MRPRGIPIGTQPIVPRAGKPVRPAGSRLPLDYARETGANFLTANALAAVRARTAVTEAHQSVDHQRLWADLLWSPTLGFNLFGDLAADLELADRAVHRWWPDAPGRVFEVRFAHSPGRLDPAYLNSLLAFDAAFVLDLGDGAKGVVGIDTRYHERAKAETPKPATCGGTWRWPSGRAPSRAGRPAPSRDGPSWPSCGWSTCCCCRCSSTPSGRGAGAASSSSTRLATATTPSLRPLPDAARGPVDFLVGDRRGAPGRRCPPRDNGRRPPRPIPAHVIAAPHRAATAPAPAPRTMASDRRWASQMGTTETSTSRTATTLTTGAWLERVRLVKIQMGKVWTPAGEGGDDDLVEGEGEGEQAAGEQGRAQGGEGDQAEGLDAVGVQVHGRLLKGAGDLHAATWPPRFLVASSTDATGRDAKHDVPLRRVRAGEVRGETFLYELQGRPCGRPPPAAVLADAHHAIVWPETSAESPRARRCSSCLDAIAANTGQGGSRLIVQSGGSTARAPLMNRRGIVIGTEADSSVRLGSFGR